MAERLMCGRPPGAVERCAIGEGPTWQVWWLFAWCLLLPEIWRSLRLAILRVLGCLR